LLAILFSAAETHDPIRRDCHDEEEEESSNLASVQFLEEGEEGEVDEGDCQDEGEGGGHVSRVFCGQVFDGGCSTEKERKRRTVEERRGGVLSTSKGGALREREVVCILFWRGGRRVSGSRLCV